MKWEFEFSIMIFLIICFLSHVISTKTRFRLTLQFCLGVICIIGFSTGILPQDFVKKSKLIEIGFIAFNVLIIHSGTKLELDKLKNQKNTIALCSIATLTMTIIVGFGLSPLIGREIALLSPGPIVGGGATSAIASISVLRIKPELSVYPWLIFMIQGLFGVPLCAVAIKKETIRLLNDYRKNSNFNLNEYGIITIDEKNIKIRTRNKFCVKIPNRYKNTAYYLGIIMIISVFNKWLNVTYLSDIKLHLSVTALIFGIVLGHFGVIDRDPLSKSNSMGLLMLGLMALMANTLAFTPINTIIMMIKPVLIVFVVATIILTLVGIIFSNYFGFSKYKGVAITLSCMVGFPISAILVQEIITRYAKTDKEKSIIDINLMPSLTVTSMLIVNVLSIFISSLLASLL